MRVIPPLTITDAILTSSGVTEPGTGETAWSGAATYALGDTVSVISANSHKVYESLQAGNNGHTPVGGTADLWWLDIGSTNRWKMFDLLRNTQSVKASPLTVVLTPGARINSIALLGLVADAVSISITSALYGGTVYTYTEDLSTREVFDWYDYFFEPFSTRESVIRFDIPPYSDAIITITLTRTSGNVSCGACVLGNYVDIGAAQYSAESDVLNFSSVTRDEFGDSTMVQRRNVPKTTQTLMLEKTRVNKVRAVRDDLNAVPAVWSGLDDTTDDYAEALIILGFYRRFSINIALPEVATVNLELEEV